MKYPRKHCQACAKPIVWVMTAAGKGMPVDATSANEGDRTFDPSRHVSHFVTCPEASTFKRRRKAPRAKAPAAGS
jgi:hypothetical protein